MYNESTRSMGNGWRERLEAKAIKDAVRNAPEVLERRKAVQERQEAERAEQIRLAAEREARRQSEFVQFPAMPVKLAAELIMAFERYRSAGREATPAEVEALSRMVQGLPALLASPTVRLMHGLQMPVPSSGFVAPAVEPMAHQPDPAVLDNVLRPAKVKREKPAPVQELESGVFLIEDDDD